MKIKDILDKANIYRTRSALYKEIDSAHSEIALYKEYDALYRKTESSPNEMALLKNKEYSGKILKPREKIKRLEKANKNFIKNLEKIKDVETLEETPKILVKTKELNTLIKQAAKQLRKTGTLDTSLDTKLFLKVVRLDEPYPLAKNLEGKITKIERDSVRFGSKSDITDITLKDDTGEILFSCKNKEFGTHNVGENIKISKSEIHISRDGKMWLFVDNYSDNNIKNLQVERKEPEIEEKLEKEEVEEKIEKAEEKLEEIEEKEEKEIEETEKPKETEEEKSQMFEPRKT